MFSRAAQRHAEAIGDWWRTNRPAAPELFADELEDARKRLSRSPYVGQPFEAAPRPRGVRRVLLAQSRYHIYYTINDRKRLVIVRAVWHATRGHGPPLR